MVYGSGWAQPPRGSTEWGARQFSRLLDEEERIAAERQRLLAMGWRPPELSFGDEAPLPHERQFILAGVNPAPTPGGQGRPPIPNYLLPFLQAPERTPANTNVPPGSALSRRTSEQPPSARGETSRPAFMNGSFAAEQQENRDRERAVRHFYALAAREMRLEEQARNRERALELLKARKASEAILQGGHPSAESAGESWLSEIGAWIPFISRDIPEDDDYCMRRWDRERARCFRWEEDWARRACMERARNRYVLCFDNGGMPDPDEPDEWSEADMERWYNPDR